MITPQRFGKNLRINTAVTDKMANSLSDMKSKDIKSIMFVIDSLGAGGAEKSLADLALGLRDQWIVSIVVLKEAPEGYHALLHEAGVPIYTIGEGGRFVKMIALLRHIKARLPDLVHTTLYDADVLGRVAARLAGVPVTSSVVNISYGAERLNDPAVSVYKLFLARQIDAFTASISSRIHAVTQAVRMNAIKNLRVNPSIVDVVYRGRDHGVYNTGRLNQRSDCRSQLGLSPESKVVLNVGRHEFQKNHLNLLRAFKLILQKVPEARLLIAGREGAATSQIFVAIEDLGLCRHVNVLGHYDNIPELLAASDVFILPSWNEGAAGAVLEAMASGVPIVCSGLATLHEVLQDRVTGIFVNPAEPTDIASAMLQLFADDKRRARMSNNALKVFRERFTIERYVDEMDAFFRRTVTSEPSQVRSLEKIG